MHEVGEDHERAETVLPVSGALEASPIGREGGEEGVHRCKDTCKRRALPRLVLFLVEEGDADRSGADGPPVVRSILPPLARVIAKVAVEYSTTDFRPTAVSDAPVDFIAKDMKRLRDVEPRLGGEEFKRDGAGAF